MHRFAKLLIILMLFLTMIACGWRTATPTPVMPTGLAIPASCFTKDEPLVWMQAVPQMLQVGETAEITVMVQGLCDLAGAEVHLSYDPTMLRVLDADFGTDGVQVSMGYFLPADFIATNQVADGEINVAIASMGNETVGTSGPLFTFNVVALQQGSVTLTFSGAQMAATSGLDLPVTTQPLYLQVQGMPDGVDVPCINTGEPTLRIEVIPDTVGENQTGWIAVMLDNACEVAGAELTLTYDPWAVIVVDADADSDGVQAQWGDEIHPSAVLRNIAENGVYECAMVSVPSAREPSTRLLTLVVVGQQPGETPLHFESARLHGAGGMQIAVIVKDGILVVE